MAKMRFMAKRRFMTKSRFMAKRRFMPKTRFMAKIMGASWVHYLPCLAYSALLAFFMYITLIVPPGVKIGKRENYSLNMGTL